MAGPDPHFWQDRFTAGTPSWGCGKPGPQRVQWLAQSRIIPAQAGGRAGVAVPGRGTGDAVVLLAPAGLDITGIDCTPAAVERGRDRLAVNENVKEFHLGVSEEGRKSLRDTQSCRRRKRWL